MNVWVPVKTKDGVRYAPATIKIASRRWVWVRIGKDEKYLYRYSTDDIKNKETTT